MKILIRITLVFTFCLFTYSAQAREHPYFTRTVRISPNGNYIGIGRLDYKLVLYDRLNKKIIKVIEGKEGELSWNIVDFTPDSKLWVFQVYKDAHYDLIFYDIEADKIVKEIDIGFTATCIAFLKNANRMVLGGTDGRIELWDLVDNKKNGTLKPALPQRTDQRVVYFGFEEPISNLIISPDEEYFISSTFSGGMRDKDPDIPEDIKLVSSRKDPHIWGNKVFEEYVVKHLGVNLWDLETLTKKCQLLGERLNGRTWPIFSPDGKYVLVTSENGGVYRFDSAEGELLLEYDRVGTDGIGFVESSGKYFITLLAIGGGQELVLWGIDKKKWLDVDLKLKYEPVTGAFATLPSQNLIVTGDTDGSISVYKFNKDKLDIELVWHPKPIKSGIIKWISPLHLLDKTPEQISELRKRYEEEQKKLIKEEQSRTK